MSRIKVEAGNKSLVSSLTHAFKDMRILSIADDIKPVELVIGQPPFSNRFYRLYPYQREDIQTGFNLEEYRKATQILSDFFTECIGNPDQSYHTLVDLTIKDYRGERKRRAQSYLGGKKIGVYMMMPTRMELQTTIIPAPDDLRILKKHPVATLMAIRDQYILSGRLFNGSIYPPVNDFGSMFPLDKLDNTGSYQHYNLDHLQDFFG